MIEPDGVLDGDHGETVAVWFGVGHGQSDYPDPIKATQPDGDTLSFIILSCRLDPPFRSVPRHEAVAG